MMLRVLLLAVLVRLCSGESPTIFVNAKAIEYIDPLKSGFQMILHEDYVRTYLDAMLAPQIYITAIPLADSQTDGQTAHNRLLYWDGILGRKKVSVSGLQERTWYCLCIEFENANQKLKTRNTSTDCTVARTLDKFGGRADAFVTETRVQGAKGNALAVSLAIDVDFPSQITVYLSGGAVPIQTYIISEPRSLRTAFVGLTPRTNYGRLCVREEPLTPMYTMMGRPIRAPRVTCYTDDIRIAGPPPTREPLRVPRTVEASSGTGVTKPWVMVYSSVFGGILIRAIQF